MENKEAPFLCIKSRRGNLQMMIHKDALMKYHRDLWKLREDEIRLKVYIVQEASLNKDIKGLQSMYNYCINRLDELLGVNRSRMGRDGGIEGGRNGGRSLM